MSPPLERDCRACLDAGECTATIGENGMPLCPKFPIRAGHVCGECGHLAPGRFIDPSPLPNSPPVYGCEMRETFIGVHFQTRACGQFAHKVEQ